ncbi:23S rRNA (adenine(1618)-N(6))-methyltransferase RlmF [Algoriphagus sp. CAU 1675]|uniref:23S rRNA (adenine(1618)-N(6))-methyltransferase RlmF n=1 Tax=Algoriphagus sp. CAU 1675 TaxID=3032597 RepID=UPI0023DADBEB|nr:23S rRNA (adenine(1618)-N(6))-methyltransferase RlmF [Algoriphagus sp. CAU 1675]MDF2156596.1 23S rRNA (adenine(1618)-N(6))-methyltransferase RlmF [Algoriphagus sp. CAU 1675]
MSKASPKPGLHPRNLHQGRYDLELLANSDPELRPWVFTNEYGNLTLDFSNPDAVKALNRALLKQYYQVDYWDIPEGYLCPPIPGRADYIHYAADLLARSNGGKIPQGKKVHVFDVGTGANLIYPILGNSIYGWSFFGSEQDPGSIEVAKEILNRNPGLQPNIQIRRQTDFHKIFDGVMQQEEFFDLIVCNPPFHQSEKEAREGSLRKVKNLTGKKVENAILNFGGKAGELWCEGGEAEFIRKMIRESLQFRHSCFWFTTLVAKEENLKSIYQMLKKTGVAQYQTIAMYQGSKKSRIVAWTFLNQRQMENWKKFRWEGN